MISHIGIANATKTPELELDDKEAKALAEASANVMAEFDIRPDPKFIAIAGLVTTATSIYGPRIYVIKQRKAEAKKNRSNSVPDNQAQFEGPLTIPPGTFNLGGS